MDFFTHATLGAIAGEAIAGKKIGNKAPIIGGLIALIPDLDILFTLFVNPVDNLSLHRGFTHSVFFPLIMAPILAYLLRKYKPNLDLSFKQWFIFFTVVLFTHPFIDMMTGYGTQFFYPFSRYAFELNTIFIIDPAFTLPMLACLIILMVWNRGTAFRRKMSYTAIVYGLCYLIFTMGMKFNAVTTFQTAFNNHEITYERMRTFPGPFVPFYWRALAETEDGFYEGYYSVFQSSEDVDFHFIPRNEHKIADIKDSYAIEELLWFSKGYYHINEDKQGQLYFNDLRFGSYFGFMGDYSKFVFSFKLSEEKPGSPYRISFEQESQNIQITSADLKKYFMLAFGKTPAEIQL